jgi:hypothetical protein
MIKSNANFLEQILVLPAKKRLAAILDHNDPGSIVRSMHPQDILLSLREIGPHDSLEIIELLEPEQVQEILDLEIWNNDEISPDKTGHYFSLLFEANAEQAVKQLNGLDIELLGLMFKMVTTIYDQTLEEEPEELSGLVSQTPDGRFIVCFSDTYNTTGLAHSLYQYLEALYGTDMKKALSLLEHIRFELASGLEVSSLKWRNARIADMGILPHDERLEYFAPITLKELGKKNIPTELQNSDVPNQLPMRQLATNINQRYMYLHRAVHDSSLPQQQNYFAALAHASLNMHASLSGDFGDQDEMLKSVEYVKTLCDYGLAQASQGKLDQAALMLKLYGVKALIRLGRTALVNLRKLLVHADKSFLWGENFIHADSPLREVARALLLPEPRFYEGLLHTDKFEVRFFNTLSELNATLQAAHELRFRAHFIGPEVLGLNASMLEMHSTLSHASIFGRVLINSYLNISDKLEEITDDKIAKIFTNNTHKNLNRDFDMYAKKFTDLLAQKLDTNSQERATSFLTAVLTQLVQNHNLLLG